MPVTNLSDEDWRRLGWRCRTMGLTYGDVAREIGTSVCTVCKNLQRLGLAKGRRGRPKKKQPGARSEVAYRPSRAELRVYLQRMLDHGVDAKLAVRLLRSAT